MRRVQHGSAFVELLIAVFVVTLLVLSIVAVSPMTTRMQTQARQYTYATNVAQTVLERVRSIDFQQITASRLLQLGIIQQIVENRSDRFVGRFTQLRSAEGVQIDLQGQLRNAEGEIEVFEEFFNGIPVGRKTVFVTVRWREPQTNRVQQVRLGTVVAQLK